MLNREKYIVHISIDIRSSPYAINEIHYGNIATEQFITSSQNTRDIVAAAQRALQCIWREGIRYMKTDVMINDFSGKEAQFMKAASLFPGNGHGLTKVGRY